jgi:tetratricopeptide (TPR) repeat protein
MGLFDSTLIIITSDHGEMLGEHREEEHSYFIYQSAIKVPLIFKLPGQGKSRGIKELVGLIDIVPTVCSLLGIQPPPQVQGIDLTGYFFKQGCPDKERYIYCESLEPTKYGCNALLGVVTDRWKYIQTTRPELYDLIKDPQESDNMVMKEPRRGHMLKERLKLILQEQLRKDSDSKVVLDEQTRKRLESLGYVSGSVAEDFEFDQSKDDPKDLIDLHLSITEVDHLISERRFAEAKKLCEKLRSQNPDFYLIYRYSAKVDFKEGDKEKAKAYMLESLKRNPNQADLHRYLSIVLAEQGKHNDAIYHLAESLRFNPYQISAHNNVAILLEEQGEREKAIVHLTESLRLKHNQPDIHIKLGNIFYQMARFDKAIKHWAESLQLNPQKPHIIHNKLGNAFHRLGMLDDAIEHWSESLKLKPEQPTIINNIAETLAQKGKKRLDYTGDKYQN